MQLEGIAIALHHRCSRRQGAVHVQHRADHRDARGHVAVHHPCRRQVGEGGVRIGDQGEVRFLQVGSEGGAVAEKREPGVVAVRKEARVCCQAGQREGRRVELGSHLPDGPGQLHVAPRFMPQDHLGDMQQAGAERRHPRAFALAPGEAGIRAGQAHEPSIRSEHRGEVDTRLRVLERDHGGRRRSGYLDCECSGSGRHLLLDDAAKAHRQRSGLTARDPVHFALDAEWHRRRRTSQGFSGACG